MKPETQTFKSGWKGVTKTRPDGKTKDTVYFGPDGIRYASLIRAIEDGGFAHK